MDMLTERILTLLGDAACSAGDRQYPSAITLSWSLRWLTS